MFPDVSRFPVITVLAFRYARPSTESDPEPAMLDDVLRVPVMTVLLLIWNFYHLRS